MVYAFRSQAVRQCEIPLQVAEIEIVGQGGEFVQDSLGRRSFHRALDGVAVERVGDGGEAAGGAHALRMMARAGHSRNLVAGLYEQRQKPAANRTRSAGDKHSHACPLAAAVW